MDEALENLVKYGNPRKPGKAPQWPRWKWALAILWILFFLLASKAQSA
ncbi:MAG: hypothetical protein ACI4QJ_08605 [Candidatus Spyradenecus sp.]